MSDAARLAESVPEMVWAAVLVKKSESLVPVSSLISTPLTVCVGTVLSNVTLPLPPVTAVPAFPAESLNAILYATEPVVSLDSVVYTAVHVFPDVFTYVTDVSVIAAPPERKVTTGVDIVSLAVNESVTLSPTAASVDVELFDAILTLLNVGAVLSFNVTVLLDCDVDAALPTASKIAVELEGTTVIVSDPLGVPDKLKPNV